MVTEAAVFFMMRNLSALSSTRLLAARRQEALRNVKNNNIIELRCQTKQTGLT
jgi:hypothetical protein